MFIKYGLPVLAVLLLGFSIYFVASRRPEKKDVSPPVPPPKTPFNQTVAGAGIIEAQTENISIGSATPGVVQEVFVKVGDRVQPGTKLFRLDDRELLAQLKQRQAAVDVAKARWEQLNHQPRQEELPIRVAQLRETEALLTQAEDQYKRAQKTFARNVTTEDELTSRRQQYLAAKARLAKAQAEYNLLESGAWQYEKQIAAANIDEAEADVEMVRALLERLVVRSLVDGEVLQVNVRPGEFVGTPPNETLILVGSVDTLHVRVDIDEHDIPRYRLGAPAKAVLKGRPEDQFDLKFVRVEPYVVPKQSLTGMNTERVDTRVLQVIYAIEPTGKPLYVGQQVDVFIDVGSDAAARPPEKAISAAG